MEIIETLFIIVLIVFVLLCLIAFAVPKANYDTPSKTEPFVPNSILFLVPSQIELFNFHKDNYENAKTPEILENCVNNMIDILEWFSEQERKYPDTAVSKCIVEGSDNVIARLRNHYNERIFKFTKEGFECDYMRGFLDVKASNYNEILKKFNLKPSKTTPVKPNHTRVNVDDFFNKYIGAIPDDLMDSIIDKVGKKYYCFDIQDKMFDDIKAKKKQLDEFNYKIDKCAELNNKGIEYEKEGRIEEAIRVYEENMLLGHPAKHSYERLMILYRKKKDYENELRVIQTAINVRMKENERRAKKSLEYCPKYKNEIQAGFETNKEVRDETGRCIFGPYEVVKLMARLEKVKSFLNKNQQSDWNINDIHKDSHYCGSINHTDKLKE